ncbi:MAG: starch-binding protein [Ruminococcus sp.]
MKLMKKSMKKSMAVLLTLTLLISALSMFNMTASAVEGTNLSYSFSGNDKDTSGYAQGTITLSSDTAGTYHIYWANDTKALDGYYEISSLTVSAGGSASFTFGYHTAIPAGATRVIATTTSDKTVANAKAVYSIPVSKQLNTDSGKLLYKFNSYSDIHIADDNYFYNAPKNFAQALKFGVDKGTDFIVTSGDSVSFGRTAEWERYERILADSDYVNPVWESNGNHDLKDSPTKGNTNFVRASGTDNTIASYDANKPYYYVTEKTTGDIFIFMALEYDGNPSSCDEFSAEQMSWLSGLLSKYYGTGVNIYIIEHSPIKGFGAGDRMSNPYYKAHLSEQYTSTVQFKALLKQYPKLIWMSGHTHEDFEMDYNYSNENGTACHMIHNPAVAGSTWASGSDTSLDYNGGAGRNSQGYYVETYENQVVYYGANLTDELIYPAYSYIMEGSRTSTPGETNPTSIIETVTQGEETGATGSTIPAGTETKRYYFANTLKWQNVNCYSWSDSDIETCVWPGYVAKYYGTNEQGVDLYYCSVPASHTKIIWNNAGNNYQTKDIILDGTNNFFTPSTTVNSKSVPVTASVWTYDEPTEPSETTPTAELGDVNNDGLVNVSDATMIQRYSAQLISLTSAQKALADVNSDGLVNVSDATTIQRLAANLIDSFAANSVASGKTSAQSADTEENAVVMSLRTSEDKPIINPVSASTLADELATVKSHLDSKYTFASYDQYQALKKYYYQYKDQTTADSSVITTFESLIADLNEIAEHIGTPVVVPVGDTYYFENTYNWSKVNCYAWTSSSNADWPGVEIQKVGTNNGHDVYGIKFEYAGQYSNVIFNNGSDQTVDIVLSSYEGNCFYLDGGSDSKGHLTVGSFSYTSSVTPTVAPVTTQQVGDDTHYALKYYNGTAHGWSDTDTYFTPQTDGTYVLYFTAKNADDISLNVYDVSSAKYNCVSASTNFTFEAGITNNYTLVASSSRGKSITIKGMQAGYVLKFVYNPTSNTLNVECMEAIAEAAEAA